MRKIKEEYEKDPSWGGVHVPHAMVSPLDLIESHEKLRTALAFAASVIKSGESWTDACEEQIGGALNGRFL
jgi:hypothetical protein